MSDEKTDTERDDFAVQAATRGGGGMVSEFWDFLKQNKKWWLAPIILSVLLLGMLVILSGSAAAPFIYTLF